MEEGAGLRDELPDLSDASNVLLLAPTDSGQSQTLCLDVIAQSPPSTTRVLAVTYSTGPAAWVEAWNERVAEPPAGGGIVSVGRDETEFEDEVWTAATVTHPGDLTGIGIELSELLSALAADADGDEQVVVCFDSVTSLLHHSDLQRAFRFLHVVTGRVRNADARCYYHLDPEAHDPQARATLDGLFDATIEYDGEGWTVSR